MGNVETTKNVKHRNNATMYLKPCNDFTEVIQYIVGALSYILSDDAITSTLKVPHHGKKGGGTFILSS